MSGDGVWLPPSLCLLPLTHHLSASLLPFLHFWFLPVFLSLLISPLFWVSRDPPVSLPLIVFVSFYFPLNLSLVPALTFQVSLVFSVSLSVFSIFVLLALPLFSFPPFFSLVLAPAHSPQGCPCPTCTHSPAPWGGLHTVGPCVFVLVGI